MIGRFSACKCNPIGQKKVTVSSLGIASVVLMTAIVSNWAQGLPSTKSDLNNPVVEGVSGEGKNEKVIPLEKMKPAKESAFKVPNSGRAPDF